MNALISMKCLERGVFEHFIAEQIEESVTHAAVAVAVSVSLSLLG